MAAKMKHWQDPVNLVLGLWMLISPWVLGYQAESAAQSNAVIVGVVIAILAALELFQVTAWEEWVNFVLGIWLLISPWVLRFSTMTTPMANAVIIGIAVAVLAIWALGTDRDIGGWWSHPTTQ
ncbi:MAG: SPW repeat protein [Rhodocyclaceae bacterium]|nr:SPW repeat protein [Rhodocyclaceae bacterium]